MSGTAITLVCNPEAEALSDDLVDDVAFAILEACDDVEIMRRTLNDGVAEDFLVNQALTRNEVESALGLVLGDTPVDIIVQPAQHRRKRLLIADMDSTIIGQECIDELADFAGLKAEISAITEKAMRGEIDFDAALIERVGMLRGLPETVLEEAFSERITLNPGAKTLVKTMNARGGVTLLVSGGFTYFVEKIARLAGFKGHQANDLIFNGGRLTGDVRRPILGRQAKEDALRKGAAEYAVPLAETLAVGDGANDLDMLAAAGLGVAYRAKPKVAAAAGASVKFADLTALLYAQGITREEFAS